MVVYNRNFCALKYMCLFLQKMSMLEELSDYRIIELSIRCRLSDNSSNIDKKY